MGSWPLNGKKGGNRKHSKIDTLPPEMKATVEEMIMDGSATYSDIVAYLEQQGYSLSVSSVCRYGYHRSAGARCQPESYDRAHFQKRGRLERSQRR